MFPLPSFRLGYRALLLLILLWALTLLPALAAGPKVHTVGLGTGKKVPALPSTTAEAAAAENDTLTLRVRPLLVDGRVKEWTTGDSHDVTDRSFAVRRAVRINDALPQESTARWIWERGPWLLVDRTTGHITVLHPPEFDPSVSEVVWFRDYAAYCGVRQTAKGQHVTAMVYQLGARRPLLEKQLSAWDADHQSGAVCNVATWQRKPLRVTFHPMGGDAMGFDIVGLSAAMVEEADADEGQ
ncbi:MAG TPA: hypothetical protein VNX22_04670 [Acidobacteriaceae bacterium]|nr:hypothetical protein [Acidobacteriaceae bacterium]